MRQDKRIVSGRISCIPMTKSSPHGQNSLTKENRISLVIPNYNGSATLARCLEAALSSRPAPREIVVADDCSTDDSIKIIQGYPCKLVRLAVHSGASAARNAGARSCTGEFLFFIDADCLLQEHTLAAAHAALDASGDAVIGGTYTTTPFDRDFFSIFQSVFIHYSESRMRCPDYIAAHAMIIGSDVFRACGGFTEKFLPIIEDVEFSHRLRTAGYKLIMEPKILVQHIFNFTLLKSLKNAFRKSRYWTLYSLQNRDVLSDSGTASFGLKMNVSAFFLSVPLAALSPWSGSAVALAGVFSLFVVNVFLNRGLLRAFYDARGISFALLAALYYMCLYPLAVGGGAARGIMNFLRLRAGNRRSR